jgi:tetratricopeptide (TPR) repeat protein
MSLKDRISEDMKAAMRAKDAPRLSTVRLLLAALKQKEVDAAARCFTQALTLDTTNPAAWVGRADARYAQGRYEEALRDYQSAATVAPRAWAGPLKQRLRRVRRALRRGQ